MRTASKTIASQLLLIAALAGCSSDSGATPAADQPATPSATPSGTPSSTPTSTPSSTPSSTPTSTGSQPADCAVPDFVPSTRIVLTAARPVVVYAHRVSLAPGSSWRSPDAVLGRLDLVPIRVRPEDRGAPVTAAQRDQILASGGGDLTDGRVPEEVRAAARIRNDSAANRTYLVYRGSFSDRGRWTIRACEGTTVARRTGTYATVEKLGPVRVAWCGHRAGESRLDRYAAQRACRTP